MWDTKWTTVCGPPTVLKKLWSSSNGLAKAARLELQAGATVHSSHLPRFDVEKILTAPSWYLNTPVTDKTTIISTSTADPYEAKTLRDLLTEMVEDIDQNQIDMVSIGKKTAGSLRGNREVDLVVVGPTNHTASMEAAFKAGSIKSRVITGPETLPSTEAKREGSGHIAIVGFSGRFPGGDNLEEFWEMLRDGRDMCTEVSRSQIVQR